MGLMGVRQVFDARLRPLINPPLNACGRALARAGISANAVTLAGLVPAIGAGLSIAYGHTLAALALIVLNRVLDGLDGAVARVRGSTDFGGYLDILADYVFYLAVPLGFAFAAPDNAIPALVLVASFTLTAVSFLAFAALAAKRGQTDSAHGAKSFLYSTGLAEGGETIAVFIAMCLWPAAFAWLAWGFAALCGLTVIQRSVMARHTFG
ncbi:CDP-alcohol phosphatidyltransferase family protein [Alteraurantiacibacter palmitatis]|uniref:CDP-alcohol phosphatidyltransferase family protein n=1 Tax=Alteraurantiacibacter palmitatis TaxID=2054628 RepID=A0ABV7E7E1_9SPHN